MPLYETIIIGRCTTGKGSATYLKSLARNVIEGGGKINWKY